MAASLFGTVGKATKAFTPEEDEPQAAHQHATIEENSSGFHIFEIHAPTVGYSLTSIIFCIAGAFLLLYIYRRCKSRWGRNRHPHLPRQGAMQPPQMWPVQHGFPGHSVIYVAEPEAARRFLPRPPPRIRELQDDELQQQQQQQEQPSSQDNHSTISRGTRPVNPIWDQ